MRNRVYHSAASLLAILLLVSGCSETSTDGSTRTIEILSASGQVYNVVVPSGKDEPDTPVVSEKVKIGKLRKDPVKITVAKPRDVTSAVGVEIAEAEQTESALDKSLREISESEANLVTTLASQLQSDTEKEEPVAESAISGATAPSETASLETNIAEVPAPEVSTPETETPETGIPAAPISSTTFEIASAEQTDDGDTAEAPDDSVVWNIETSSAARAKPEEVIIPEGQDPSLAEDALSAAFSLVRQQSGNAPPLEDQALPEINIPAKQGGKFRVAIMLPMEGSAEQVSRDIHGGAELAMFKLAPDHMDLVFIDTSEGIDDAVVKVRQSQADVILGPLFSGNTIEARRKLADRGITMISLSNDVRAASNNVFMLGQSPEQEIAVALGHTLSTFSPIAKSGRRSLSIAVISDQSPYGTRVADKAVELMRDAGLRPAARVVLDEATLNSEKNLRAALRKLTRWSPTPDGETRIPPYDVVILAGDISFSLRVAPVLAWYDLDPERVRYLGTSLWASPAIMQEPSLKGGVFATAPVNRQDIFNRMWQETGAETPGKFAPLGFDAVALTAMLSADQRGNFKKRLTEETGFAGFSGTFRFQPDGLNLRLLDVRQIDGGKSRVIAPAAEGF